MLDRLISASLRARTFVVFAALGLAVFGSLRAASLPKDVLPDLARPRVTVLTEAHGYGPIDVEQLITRPIEQRLMATAGVVDVRSKSEAGLSSIVVDFAWGEDIYRARQLIQEKLQLASSAFPEGIQPALAPMSSLLGQIQIIGVRSISGATDATAIRMHVDRHMRLALQGVRGVAQIIVVGGAPRQMQVEASAALLRAHGVGLDALAEAIREANHSASGGFVPLGARGPLVTATGRVRGPEDLRQAAVRPGRIRSVTIQDVGTVQFGPAALRVGEAGIDGGPGVLIVVAKQPGVDTLALTSAIDGELERLRAGLPADLEILPGLFRQADFIERAVDNVSEAVWLGGLLVVLVLLLFLMNLRTTLITLTALPLSVAVTALVFDWFGIGVNTMTLGGLAVAIGALVDDAIVDVENVFRRLKQNRLAEHPRSPLAVVFLASSEVRKPILVGTFLVIAVYLPLFALSGMEGRLFQPIGLAYIISILASLVVALTVTPVLCSLLLPKAKAVEAGDGRVVRMVKGLAESTIRFSVRHPVAITAGLGLLVVLAVGAMAQRGREFLPAFNEGTAQVTAFLPAGSSLATSDAYGRRLEDIVKAVPGVGHVARRSGRAEGDEHAMDVSVSEMIVTFDPASSRSRAEILGQIRHDVRAGLPGLAAETEQPLAHLLSHLLSGVTAQVAIKMVGEDLPTLRRVAQRIESAIQGIEGVVDLRLESQVLVDRVEIQPRRQDLARRGMTVDDIAETVELALEGEVLTRFIEGPLSWPIVLRLREEDRGSLEAIRGLLIERDHAAPVRLGDVAEVRLGSTPTAIQHDNAERRIVVSHNVEGRPLGDVVLDVRAAIAEIERELPPGYGIRLEGQFQAQEEAMSRLLWLSLVSLLVMVLLLYFHFQSVNLAAQILLNIPSAFIGAALFVVLFDQTVSVATLVGLVSLGGIASRNGILLIDHYLHLMKEEQMPFGIELLVRAGRERIVPVMMTALTSGIALVPLLVGGNAPGRELLHPIATVIVGGLITTTILDLLLTPGVFYLFGRGPAEAHLRRVDPGATERERMAAMLEGSPVEQPPVLSD